MSNNSDKKERKKFATVEAQKIAITGAIIVAVLGLVGTGITAWVAYSSNTIPINATQTAEALLTISAPSSTSTFTDTPSPTLTYTPTLSPIQVIEATIPVDMVLYDTFDVDGGKWKITDDSTQCTHTLENGTWKFECFGSAIDRVTYTMLASDDEAKTSVGVEMAFYTLPILEGKSQWGKYQLLLRFGSDCGNPQRNYVISITPNELFFIEANSKGDSINPPSPAVTIGTLEPHTIRIEMSNGLVRYYLDGLEIRNVVPLENSSPICWMFQSQDNNKLNDSGYRGVTLLWFAIKP